ncbi:Git1 glycerophosphoinositol permease [Candida orthopsilosis Co 90-125]|uniref:Git1 glycerophosphoinositol permease n=1 Tax=Candida orthopsilosis (strain 90-125) TaxID=1136231 RepID=H8X4B8_CANO9|nr:Git1 glycerophosphoinositol permease [Candida orthopsilosis Co 90-125]CCG26070.1 Git1 glycerophosphoinositol permease [Candida orthopsilosis Co 90-125]
MSTTRNQTDKSPEVVETVQTDGFEPLHSSDVPPQKQYYTYDAEARRHRLDGGVKLRDALMILCAGFALISDGYQNNVMSMLNKVFAIEYPKVYDTNLSTQVSNASLVGTIFGQLVIGICADLISRKSAIIIATCFLIFGSALCAASHGKTVLGMFWMLTIMRGVTGFGIGAEYPSSSVTASEAANESVKRRGMAFILATNVPLAFGGPFASIIFLIVNKITKTHYDALWRTMFAIGCFWPLSVFYFRMKMVTSVLFKKNAIRHKPPYWLALKYYWPRLLGTTVTWFLYDFVTFPNGIFSATIISNVISDTSDLEKIAEWNLLLGAIALPGCFVGAYIVDKIGKKYTMLIGFIGYIVFGLIVGIAYYRVKKITALFIVLYGLMQSFGNAGMGNVLGLVSSESFATPVRGTGYGISAIIGKVGAVCGTKAFDRVLTIGGSKASGQRYTFIIAACCGLLGVIVTWIFIPHLKTDDLLEEDVKFKNYLREQGWNGTIGLKEENDEENLDSSEDSDVVELQEQKPIEYKSNK